MTKILPSHSEGGKKKDERDPGLTVESHSVLTRKDKMSRRFSELHSQLSPLEEASEVHLFLARWLAHHTR